MSAKFPRMVGNWLPFGRSGGLFGHADRLPLADYYHEDDGATIDTSRSFVFGASQGGDKLIYAEDGRGGWLCVGDGTIHLLGSIEDTINWVYAELLAGRLPEL